MVFGSNNKKILKSIYHKAKKYIFNLRLEFKYLPNVRNFVNFLGFVFVRGLTKLRHKLFYRLEETVRKAKEHVCFSVAKRLIAFFSWLKNMAIGYIYYRNHIKPIVRIGKLKRIMSKGEVCYG